MVAPDEVAVAAPQLLSFAGVTAHSTSRGSGS
jgi:hypothetical protein